MYDYVVVGAGSAGSALAARLSEDPAVQVALIEAGPRDTAEEIHIPVAFPALFKGPLDWDLDSEPEPGLGGRRAYLPRGRVLGGSSSMNAMIYIRGAKADYDEWAAAGADGWSYDEVLPYFLKSEDNERGKDAYHGVGGPLSVSDGRSLHPLCDAYLAAAEQAGYSRNEDFNGVTQLGVGRYQLTQRNGMRCSTAVAFLHPALERPNLTVITGAVAQRVLFDGDRATGVAIVQDGEQRVIDARREVVLAAGAYGSAHLLLLSGVGPAEQLSAFGIDVVRDLPVGEHLQDHPSVFLNYRTDRESLMTALTGENVALLQEHGRGPLTSNVGEAGGFIQTRAGLAGPDVQFHQAPVLFHEEGLGAPVTHGFAMGACVIKPTSRGRLSLRSASPGSAPRIVHNYLTTEEDRASMVAGLRIVLEMAAQPALREVITGEFSIPASDSDADLLDFARRTAQTLYHPTSTCAIGAVVDPRLRVFGLRGLRVADASVMPSVVRGNTNAPTIMIGEKAAAMIAEELESEGTVR
ncbi:GMC family oxidoreductase [Nocardia bhagyanarayanae]|uniref:Choline dehydrogenase-like flavoprotein n=1 Tax=Nocardia bhagyanarayanae TaxID=1215925 RepID=A0A543FEX9_9NOCA|nr:GMC family oxidoreductase N-terminal domain-containing protein [Nocardia bhagyanarayanae]TQM32407.1 choline dehydrogenase-like flavoprotein [Nocardia bhagyanarayanae]